MSAPALASDFRPRRITVDEYHRMLEVGILRDRDPIELLDGLLVLKDRSTRGEDPMSVGKPHAVVVDALQELSGVLRRYGCYVRILNPLTLPPHDEPEPDGALVRGCPRDYLTGHPGPMDVLCVFEVADSSLAQDRTRKGALYASAGIPQYVLVNLVDERLEVFTRPRAKLGKYGHVSCLRKGAALSLNCGGGRRVSIPVRDLLP